MTRIKNENNTDELVKYGEGGATRSKVPTAYHLIPPIAHKAEAVRFAIGREYHGEGNWKHGDKQFVKEIFNHLELHLADLKECGLGKKESVFANVGAIKWAASALLWYENNKPDIFNQALNEMQMGLAETPTKK